MVEKDREFNPLEGLANKEPDAQAIDRAVSRVRAVLSQSERRPVHKRSWLLRIAGGIAACLVVVLTAWLVLHESTGTAFAAVQDRVARTRSVEFCYWYSSRPEHKILVRTLESGQSRRDLPTGSYVISQPASRLMLVVDPDKQEAAFIVGLAGQEGLNLYERIRQVPDESVVSFGEHDIDGRRVQSYRTKPGSTSILGGNLTVWVDLDTQLPVRMESAAFHNGKSLDQVIYSDIRFDQDYDPNFFSISPPPDYRILTLGEGQWSGESTGLNPYRPDLKPGVGAGVIRFSMSPERVVELLGDPDEWTEDKTCARYPSRGFAIHFGSTEAVKKIECYAPELAVNKPRRTIPAGAVRQPGRTIGIRSSRETVRKVYGEADEIERQGEEECWHYQSLGLSITLTQDRVSKISIEEPSTPDK